MKSPQLCLLLLAVNLIPGTTVPADPLEILVPERKDDASPGRLLLRAISGLPRPPPAAPHRSPQLPVLGKPPRERKAGCKTFFWKTLTSC
ncbi:hypothetical protein JRQ81_004512 [Phrynocephalus forsythii]|uniref:Somatostatin/Cortistatin C-terminal domain-containing protein n=1 Tax=Phrynocephalus forsythii TaxID=171643 RepID=A0A9Q0XFE3_9SAUR|nr:hypothetical protein JRQ81_004512 [Phrynocephalus forsythii]